MTTYKILLVEDDRGIAEGMAEALRAWNLEAHLVRDFQQVMTDFAKLQPHLVLMDISLPCMNGYHWCQEIRKSSSVPIIFISSASENMNIIMAMNMGADDFIAKPFDSNVLVAKVQALLRRTYDFGVTAPVLEYGGAVLATGDQQLVYGEKRIELSKNEYRIIYTLLQNRGAVVSREKLMEVLWESDSFIDENTLTVNVARLRKKLEAAGLAGFIETKFGQGYIVGAAK